MDYLFRYTSGDSGTFGRWLTPCGWTCFTIELPWRDNQANISCIPAGIYDVKPHVSRRFGKCLLITNVEGRTWILTHSGNIAGDTVKGFKTHSQGCILPGRYRGMLQVGDHKQPAVLCSRPTLQELLKLKNNQPFKLNIMGVV